MMAAVWVRARAELRRRWRATVLLAVLVGLAGGVVLAAVAGSRRTGSAMDRFLAYNRPLNVGVAGLDMAAVERLPHVADVDEGSLVPLVADTPSGPGNPPATGVIAAYATVHGRTGVTSERAIVVRGRRPDPGRPLEVAVNEPLAARRHLRPGDRLRAVAYSPRQFERGVDSSAIGRPRGPALDLTVTGVVRRPGDLSPVPIQQDVIYLGADTMELSPAFWAAYHDSVANLGVFVGLRLHGGPAELDAFTAAVRALPGGHQAKIEIGSDAEAAAGKARRAMRVQAVALLVFAVLAALAGLLVVGQAIARQVQLDTGDMSVLRAVGMTRSQLVAATLVPAGLVGAGGALLAVALAVLASPLTPIGLAREAEIDPGLSADGTVLALGGLAVLLAVPARAAVAAWWATRAAGGRAGGQAPGRSSRVVDRVARAGATPSAVTGIRMALESGRGDTAAPARAAVVGAAVAVVAVTASLTFAASLGHLVGSPALQGWNWDVAVGNPNDDADITARGELLAGNADVAGYSAFEQPVERVKVQGTAVPVFGMSPVKGAVLPVVLHGREARTPDELSLGPGTLRQLRRGLGDVVQVEGATERRALRIVGEVLLPNLASSATMTTGALLTVEGVHALLPAARPPGQFVVEYAAGADHAAAYASLRRDFGPTVLRASPPNEVENLRRVSGLPVLLAALLAVLGAATLGHLLVTVIRRRRRDLGVLKTIGFVRGQVAATVAWQATTLALVALLVGLPLGLVAGRWAWLLVNQELGSLAGPVTPTVALLAAVPATVLVANLVAALPARSAAATRPAVVLRSE
jgi:FtsX-like permease family